MCSAKAPQATSRACCVYWLGCLFSLMIVPLATRMIMIMSIQPFGSVGKVQKKCHFVTVFRDPTSDCAKLTLAQQLGASHRDHPSASDAGNPATSMTEVTLWPYLRAVFGFVQYILEGGLADQPFFFALSKPSDS